MLSDWGSGPGGHGMAPRAMLLRYNPADARALAVLRALRIRRHRHQSRGKARKHQRRKDNDACRNRE
jgi:hypothetical protein